MRVTFPQRLQFLDKPQLIVGPGRLMLCDLEWLWSKMEQRQRNIAIWDTPLAGRMARLLTLVGHSPFAAIGYEIDKDGTEYLPASVAWLAQTWEGAGTATIHIAARKIDPDLFLRHGQGFVEQCRKYLQTLVALIPVQFLGTCALAHDLGFEKAAVLRRASYSFEHDRYLDCIFYTLDLREKENA